MDAYRILNWTQHWRLIGGRWYRDAEALHRPTGRRRLISVPEDLAA